MNIAILFKAGALGTALLMALAGRIYYKSFKNPVEPVAEKIVEEVAGIDLDKIESDFEDAEKKIEDKLKI